MAIFSLLAALLFPALSKTRGYAYVVKCKGTLKQFGSCLSMYLDDSNDYLADNSPHVNKGNGLAWTLRLAPYLGRDPSKSQKPHAGNKTFTCPSALDGIFWGNFPSYHINGHVSNDVNVPTSPLKVHDFMQPWGKVYLGDNISRQTRFKASEFAQAPNGNVGTDRHFNHKANFIFLDLHVGSYGAPEIPAIPNWQSGDDWLLPKVPAPKGL